MSYKPKQDEWIKVYLRYPYKEHFGGTMIVQTVHKTNAGLHYIVARDLSGRTWELKAKLFFFKKWKPPEGPGLKKGV